MLKLRSRNRRGFTLVELLVAIAMHTTTSGACPIGANVALADGSVRFVGESVD